MKSRISCKYNIGKEEKGNFVLANDDKLIRILADMIHSALVWEEKHGKLGTEKELFMLGAEFSKAIHDSMSDFKELSMTVRKSCKDLYELPRALEDLGNIEIRTSLI